MFRWLSVLLVMLIVLIFPAAAYTQEDDPYWPTEGWRTSSPEAQGMETGRLVDLLAVIDELDVDIDGVVVVRNGYLVMEAYRYPYQPDTPHNLQSCTKSVTSALVGIAMQQGLIESVDQPVIDLFPAHDFANLNDAKRALMLDHVLTMRSGLPLEKAVPNDAWLSDTMALALLDLPMRAVPGEPFTYNGTASQLLAEIVVELSGQTTLDFATTYLFEPLGIETVLWDSMGAEGHVNAGAGLWLTPRDLAKFGYLYARQGEWDGVQIVSPEWVAASTASHLRNPALGGEVQADGYGYQWWVDDDGYYTALGAAGQILIVHPDLDLIAAFTSSLDANDEGTPRGLFTSFILPAVQSDTPLPEDPAALAELDARVQALAMPDPAEVPPLPPVAERISGKTYTMDDNTYGLSSLMLEFEPGAPEATLTLSTIAAAGVYTVGLDDVFRMTPFAWGTYDLIDVTKGRWIDDSTFEIVRGLLGSPYYTQMLFQFEDTTVRARIWYHGYYESTWLLTGTVE